MASTNSSGTCARLWGTRAVSTSASQLQSLALGIQLLYQRKKIINLGKYSFSRDNWSRISIGHCLTVSEAGPGYGRK